MNLISLNGQHCKGHFAIVDDDEYVYLSKYTWEGHRDGSCYTRFYGGVNARTGRGLYESRFMHQFIMQPDVGFVVDHKNGNKLDNRKENLRICTNTENVRYQRLHKNNTSGYKGVHFHRRCGKWVAQITVDRRVIYLGIFTTPQEAALTYNEAATRHFGEFALLNEVSL